MITNYIIKQRTEHHRLGKEKLSILIKKDLNINIGHSSVGRIIKRLKDKRLIDNHKRLRISVKTGKLLEINRKKKNKQRLKKYISSYLGDVIQIDTIVRYINGIKRYIVTGVDTYSKFSFAYTYNNHSSVNTSDFLDKLTTVCPFKINKVNTDNGSEFAGYFENCLKKYNISHYHSYPHCPKMNAVVERFNRTIEEEVFRYNKELCGYDIDGFNVKLMGYLI